MSVFFSPVAEETQKDDRVTITLKLTPKAKAMMEGIRAETRVPNSSALEQIIEHFCSLDRRYRLAILNRDEETRRELAVDVLSKMAGSPNLDELRSLAVDMDLVEAAKVMQVLSARVLAEARAIEELKKKKG